MKLHQLSLRDLFWLVLVAACLCGWWVEQWRTGAVQEQELNELRDATLGQLWENAAIEQVRLTGGASG